jgi:hypothetical protein
MSEVKPDHFYAHYPIDIDHPLESELTMRAPAREVLKALRRSLPYTFRFGSHPDLDGEVVVNGASTMRDAIAAIVRQLPSGWQATALPGYVILYKESARYAHGTTIAVS